MQYIGMSLANAWTVPDCDTVLDGLAAVWSVWHRSLCLLIKVGKRWYWWGADSPGAWPVKHWKTRTTMLTSKRLHHDSQWSCHSISVIIIIMSMTTFMVLSSWQSHCESSPGSFDECRMAPSGRRPKTKPDNLGCESTCTGCQKLHPPSPFIIITQPESWYSFYRPTEGRRLESI